MRILRMALRQARQGNYKPVWFVLRAWSIGLSHWWCRGCGALKGPSLHTRCARCQVELLFHALKTEAQ